MRVEIQFAIAQVEIRKAIQGIATAEELEAEIAQLEGRNQKAIQGIATFLELCR